MKLETKIEKLESYMDVCYNQTNLNYWEWVWQGLTTNKNSTSDAMTKQLCTELDIILEDIKKNFEVDTETGHLTKKKVKNEVTNNK